MLESEVNPDGLGGHGVFVVERRLGFRSVRIHDSYGVGPVLPMTTKTDTLRPVLTFVDEPQHLQGAIGSPCGYRHHRFQKTLQSWAGACKSIPLF